MNEWIEYQPKRERSKTFYDIMLQGGEIVECCYPNADCWYPMHPEKQSKYDRLLDSRVTHIRVCKHPEDYE